MVHSLKDLTIYLSAARPRLCFIQMIPNPLRKNRRTLMPETFPLGQLYYMLAFLTPPAPTDLEVILFGGGLNW